MPAKKTDERLERLLDHYSKGTQDNDTRRTRKNGWNSTIDAYMNKLPTNWPYTAMVTDPRIRTTILEKTARLLNAKLQGRLVPREGGDVVKAKIQNAILDFQWDAAQNGGAMIEKVARADQLTRLFGASFALVYWDNDKNGNEIKIWDPRDIFVDPSASHIRNAKWVQLREFTTFDALEARGYDVAKVKKALKQGNAEDSANDMRSTTYTDQVRVNRGLEDRVGEDPFESTVELVTEYTNDRCLAFLPRHGAVVKDVENPYQHGQIPVAQLRYYPLGDDVYGESEVESVVPLQRAINAVLCGFIDEMNLTMRPPVKLVSAQVRMETIEYGPGAKWIMNDINAASEMQMGGSAVQSFNATYPALVAAFNTAMGDQSLGVSNVRGEATKKTATEVASLEKQQNQRDEYNQLYLSEFLKDIMMMWLSNNKQYLFDDPSKKYFVLKIVGKDQVQAFQQMQLDDKDIPPEAMQQVMEMVEANPEAVTDEILNETLVDLAVPTSPIVTNPNAKPEEYEVKQKLDVKRPDEAELYVEPSDFDGTYDYVPDVKSMSAGAGIMAQQGRQTAMEIVLNPTVNQMLQMQGETLKIKELLANVLEDAGYKDAESLFQPAANPTLAPGTGAPQPGAIPPGADAMSGMGAMPQAVPDPAMLGGMAGPQGLPIPGEAFA